MNNISKVSVIIPTFKRPKYLKRAIESVLNQTYKNIEIIVVDDNNKGDKYSRETETLMKKFNDSRVNYIQHKVNKNGSAARNTGINNSSGKYITFLDDDDEFLLKKIERQVVTLENLDESWIACYTLINRFIDGRLIDKSTDMKSGNIYLDVFKNELYFNSGSNLFVRSNIVKGINGFDESFKRMQDLEFLIRVAEKGKVAAIDTHLLNVHLEDRQNAINYSKLIECNNHFLSTFNGKIKKLPKKEQQKIYLSKNLVLLKEYIYDKRFLKGIIHIVKNQISIIVLLRYTFYLINRKFRKVCYGFKFK